MKFNVVIIFALFLLLTNCKKEKIKVVELERQVSWKKHDGFEYGWAAQLNTYATNDRICFMGRNTFSTIVADGTYNEVGSPIHYFNHRLSDDYKLPISDDFYVSSIDERSGYINMAPIDNPRASGTATSLHIAQIDSGFYNLELSRYWRGECMAINSLNQLLVPYNKPDISTFGLVLADINVDRTYFDVMLRLGETRSLEIKGPEGGISHIMGVFLAGDDFLVSCNNRTYKVSTKGELQTVLDKVLYQVVEYNGILYGIGFHKIFTSSDIGNTWVEQGPSGNILQSVQFAKVDDRVIGYRYAQLWEMVFDANGFTFIELDNDGLRGHRITSMAEFQGVVYVSTLTGVFTRSLDSFFTFK